LKRLKYYIGRIQDYNSKPNLDSIYKGECTVIYVKPNGECDSDFPGSTDDNVYWNDDISYAIDRTNRMAHFRPTISIAIPVSRLGLEDFTPAGADFCLRKIKPYFDEINAEYANKARPDSENGKFLLYQPKGEVLLRNTAYFAMRPQKHYTDGPRNTIFVCRYNNPLPDVMCLCVRMEAWLPFGKLKRLQRMLCQQMPDAVEKFVAEFDHARFREAVELERTQNGIRKVLREQGYCAFIANGSILPREKNTHLPMKNALPFQSTPEDEVELCGIRGMGIRAGVTVITGGGYSGKSTLLNAIAAGVHNHVAGDGRELCITDDTAVTITAEDGRAVSSLNISPFIKWIPGGDTMNFSTTHASGSTSQAANIMEAVECGSGLLLIDEDRSATNFMIRDSRMKQLIAKEPITPFTDRVQELATNGVSTILVIGGSGEYLAVADKVYMMDEFRISDVSGKAKIIAPTMDELPTKGEWATTRRMQSGGFTSFPAGSGTERLEVSDTGFIIVGDEKIDIRALHNIATPAQVDALALMLRHMMQHTEGDTSEMVRMAMEKRGFEVIPSDKPIDVTAKITALYAKIAVEGLDVVDTGFFVTMERFLDLPRQIELRAAINRMRYVTWEGV